MSASRPPWSLPFGGRQFHLNGRHVFTLHLQSDEAGFAMPPHELDALGQKIAQLLNAEAAEREPIEIGVTLSGGGGLVDSVRTDYAGPASFFVADEDIIDDGCAATRDEQGNRVACGCRERYPNDPHEPEDLAEHAATFEKMRRFAALPTEATW